jgi:hypothetical protein
LFTLVCVGDGLNFGEKSRKGEEENTIENSKK